MTDTTTTFTTSNRGEALAAALDATNERIVAAVAACTDEQWRRPTAAEGWPVGVVAHHVAEVQQFFAGVLAATASGEVEPMSLTSAAIDENNARHARDAAGVGRDDTLALLRAAGADAARALRGLADDRFDAVVAVIGGQDVTGAEAAEFALIGHFEEHLASIRAAMQEA